MDDSCIGSIVDGLGSRMTGIPAEANYDKGLKACINNYNIKTFYSTRVQPFFKQSTGEELD